MNKKSYPLSDLNAWLGQADDLKILLPEKPRLDQVAAATALSASLNKSGKKTQVVCSRPLTVEFSQVVGVEKITNQLEGRSFIININYSLANIEKINWDDREQERVSLIIEPKPEAPSINDRLVSFKKGSGSLKNAIVFGFSSQKELDQTIKSLGVKKTLDSLSLVNINLNRESEFFGQIKLIDLEASSFSEIVAGLIEGLSLPIEGESAGNLLLGLQAATNSFSVSGLGPDTFEAAAFCLRAGGQLLKNNFSEQTSPEKTTEFARPKIYRGSAGD